MNKKSKKMGYISASKSPKMSEVPKGLLESFKAVVQDDKIVYPKDLGVKHPFDFELMQKLYKSHGFVTGAVDKHVDSMVGEFNVSAKDDRIQALIDNFILKTNFQVILREWIKQALITGNGFIELDFEEENLRVLDSNQMYVKRDKKGNIEGYNQFFGGNRLSVGNNKVKSFKVSQIAHLKLNSMPLEAYGIGIIWSNRQALNFLIKNQTDLHKLMGRKATAPIHVKIGREGEITNPKFIDEMKAKLEYLNNSTEWVTDANVEMKVVDFGKVGEKYTSTLDFDLDMLYFGFQVPEVVMGKGNIPEGLAKVQMETFNKRIKSLQEETEKVIEDQIFKPFLRRNGFDEHVEFEWNLPSAEEIDAKIAKLKELLGDKILIDENMRRMIQIELAKTLGITNYEDFLPLPQVGANADMTKPKEELSPSQKEVKDEKSPERKKEEDLKQPEIPRQKPAARANHEHSIECMHGEGCGDQLTEKEAGEMTLREWTNLQEIAGFTYTDYVAAILKNLRKDQFIELVATNEKDLRLGLLPQNDIEKLRQIMQEGFRENKTIKQIENEINNSIELKDRLTINEETGEEKLVSPADKRANSIARTESSRLAHIGLVDTYKSNNIKKVQFLAALSDRTCPICLDLNSQIYTINEADGIIPVHTSCRCTFIPVTE